MNPDIRGYFPSRAYSQQSAFSKKQEQVQDRLFKNPDVRCQTSDAMKRYRELEDPSRLANYVNANIASNVTFQGQNEAEKPKKSPSLGRSDL